jgi:hypothetical protein
VNRREISSPSAGPEVNHQRPKVSTQFNNGEPITPKQDGRNCQESEISPAGEEVRLNPCDQPVGLSSLGSESSGDSPQEALQIPHKN